jgi:predicted Fe-S protein YdhL (DUF1289 family)
MSTEDRPAASMRTPCIKVCIVDGESGLCMGCYRRLNEVAGWSKMSPEARDAVMADLPSRRSLIRPEKLAMFS